MARTENLMEKEKVTKTVETTERLTKELELLINHLSEEDKRITTSNTPHFILAKFMVDCLAAFEVASRHREAWFASFPSDVGSGDTTKCQNNSEQS